MCSTELPYLLRSNPSKRTDSSFQPSIKHHPPFLNFSPQTSIFFPFLAQSMTPESPAPSAAGAPNGQTLHSDNSEIIVAYLEAGEHLRTLCSKVSRWFKQAKSDLSMTAAYKSI
jgi:hypothetical protein